VPALLVHYGIAVGRRRLEKAIIRVAQPARQILRRLLGLGRQARVVEEILAHGLPAVVGDEEIIEAGKTLAVMNREIAGLELVTQLHQQGAFPRPPVDPVTVANNGSEALRHEVNWGICGQLAPAIGVHFLEHLQGTQACCRLAVSVLNKIQGVEEGRRELTQHPVPPHDAMGRIAALAGHPFADFLGARRQLFARYLGKEAGAQFAIGDGVVKDDAA
jgi:hypothetical protein